MDNENLYLRLITAIENNNSKDTERYLKEDPSVASAANEFGRTPMHKAAERDFVSTEHRKLGIMKMLARAGADVNATDFWGRTPLHIAVQNRFEDAIETLVELGAKADIPDSQGTTPMDLASSQVDRSPIAEHLQFCVKRRDERLAAEKAAREKKIRETHQSHLDHLNRLPPRRPGKGPS